MNTIAQKIEFYALILQRSIIVIQDLFGDGLTHYYAIFDWVEYNPSNNHHKNNLRQCKCIDMLIQNAVLFDEQSLKAKFEELHMTQIEFSNNIKWAKVS